MGILDRVKSGANIEDEKLVSTLDIFDSLIHQEGYSYLRSNQKDFLVSWEKIRDKRDVVGILNTGAGKTLIGLLMLMSKMNEGVGPSVYLCPDNQLVDQVIKQAKQHNIPVIGFDQRAGISDLPLDFLNSKSILVTTFEKLFNGKSIFGVAGYANREIENIGSILVDDAHSCIRKARSQATLEIDRQSVYYDRIFSLFKSDLEKQGRGQLRSIIDGEHSVSKMVPYWCWKDNISEIKQIISEMYSNGAPEITFVYNLIIDYIETCRCYISGNKLEITPSRIPLEKIPSYNHAKHRFILSATFSNSSDLISELGIDKEAVENPLEVKNISDVGERLVLAPVKYHPDINVDFIGNALKKFSENRNVVVLTPSKFQAKKWEKQGATIVRNNISMEIENLSKTSGNFLVFVNRYDGIDLNGDICHFLVIDGIPKGETVKEKAESIMRPNSNYLISKRAQSIEQGLGRAVRSGSDYCVVFLMGDDLLTFIGKRKNLKYFSLQTQSQLELAMNLVEDIKKDSTLEDAWNEIRAAVNLCLSRNTDWINMYKTRLKQAANNENLYDESRKNLLEIAQHESDSFNFYSRHNNNSAYDSMNKIVSLLSNNQDIGWYYQTMGEIYYTLDKTRSNELQILANKYNENLLVPIHPISEKKRKPSSSQAKNSCEFISGFTTNMDLLHFVRTNLAKLKYDPNNDHKEFENAIYNMGMLLGYDSTTPEKTLDNGGPDNLWRTPEYSLIIECKNEVINGVVAKKDLGQLLETLDWYNVRYMNSDDYLGIFFHPYCKLDRRASYSAKIKVVNEEKMIQFKDNIQKFTDALCIKNISDWSSLEVDELLKRFNLPVKSFIEKFTVDLVE